MKQQKAEDSNTESHLLARFRDVHVEVDKVGVIECSGFKGPDNCTSCVSHRLVMNYTVIDHIFLFPILKRD